ncbi:MAG: hypothetical protein WAO75_02925 [Atribacterales bacterium]
MRERRPFVAPLKKHKDKNQRKKQKLGFPIKDLGNDGGGSFLNGSIALIRHPGNF